MHTTPRQPPRSAHTRVLNPHMPLHREHTTTHCSVLGKSTRPHHIYSAERCNLWVDKQVHRGDGGSPRHTKVVDDTAYILLARIHITAPCTLRTIPYNHHTVSLSLLSNTTNARTRVHSITRTSTSFVGGSSLNCSRSGRGPSWAGPGCPIVPAISPQGHKAPVVDG